MNTKFKSIVTGAILEPNSEMVAEIAVPDGATKAEIVELIKAAQGDE